MLWLLLGDYGSGKTLYLVLEAFSSKREVWGNFKLDMDNYTRIEPMDLNKLGSDKLVLLDEMQTWLESRVSMSFQNRFITNIIDQADKRNVDFFGTAHLFTSVDVRFRSNVHRIIRCERKNDSSKRKSRSKDYRDFKYSILNTYSGKVKNKRLRYNKARKYFPKYETTEIIEYPNQKDMVLDLLLRYDQPKAYILLHEIAEKLMENNGSEFTHPKVELDLMKIGYSSKHGRLVYQCIKELKRDENK